MSTEPTGSVLHRTFARLARRVRGRIRVQPRHLLHLAVLTFSGIVALAGGTASGSFQWLGQHATGRVVTSNSSKGNVSLAEEIQLPTTSWELPIEGAEDESDDPSIAASAQALAQFDAGGIDQANPASSQEPEALARPLLSSRGGERPVDDVVKAAPKKKAVSVFNYQVVQGDTLLGLAERFGISADTILWANDLKNGGELLQIGQGLTIVPVSGVMHTVKEGDTLLSIAFKHEASPEDIIDANALDDPNVLSLGQQIIVPGGRQVPAPAPVPPLPVVEHKVQAGDTVGAVALMHAVEPIVVVRANGLSNPDAISIGRLLSVPGGKPAEVRIASASGATAESTRSIPSSRGGQAAATPTQAQAAPPSPASPPAPKPSSKGDEIVAAASGFAGGKYLWGGHSPATGFDCSGFTWYIYKQVGINIPQHDLWGQIRAGRAVKRDELLPGDLVFFQNTYQPGLSHSGIYVGNGRFISAASEGSGIRFDRLDDPYWGPRYFGASRPW